LITYYYFCRWSNKTIIIRCILYVLNLRFEESSSLLFTPKCNGELFCLGNSYTAGYLTSEVHKFPTSFLIIWTFIDSNGSAMLGSEYHLEIRPVCSVYVDTNKYPVVMIWSHLQIFWSNFVKFKQCQPKYYKNEYLS